jgi:hypothetical protein
VEPGWCCLVYFPPELVGDLCLLGLHELPHHGHDVLPSLRPARSQHKNKKGRVNHSINLNIPELTHHGHDVLPSMRPAHQRQIGKKDELISQPQPSCPPRGLHGVNTRIKKGRRNQSVILNIPEPVFNSSSIVQKLGISWAQSTLKLGSS